MAVDVQALAAPFNVSVDDPQVQAVIAAAQQEGVGDQETGARLRSLFDAYSQIYNRGGIDAAAALSAARKFVGQSHEVGAALDTVGGLLNAAQLAQSGTATPPDIAASFTGPVIAAMTAAGAFSAGTGAAIVAGIAAASALLDAAGVFPNKPGFEVCPGFKLTTPNPPDFAIGCVAAFDPRGAIVPGSAAWRPFPEPNNAGDGWWYWPPTATSDSTFKWRGATWIVEKGALNSAPPVIAAFPEAMAVFQDPTSFHANGFDQAFVQWGVLPANASAEQLQAFADFQRGFATAWKANKAFWLNGRHGADDWQVLQHLVELWNRAHEAGQGLDVGDPGPDVSFNVAGGGLMTYAPYFTTLVRQLTYANASNVLTPDGGKLHLHTGPLKSKPIPLRLAGVSKVQIPQPIPASVHSGFSVQYMPAAAPAKASSRVASAVVTAASASAIGLALFALVKHVAASAALHGATSLFRRKKP